MISESVWNVGGNSYNNPNTPPYGLPLLDQYNKERGIITYQNSCPTTWTGKVGLIYASDYGYASTNSECRENLRSGLTYDKENEKWDYSNGKCKKNNWLFKSNWFWTITPFSNYSYDIFGINSSGVADSTTCYRSLGIFPSIYLKSNILFTSGTGEKDSPYKLSL